MTIKGQSEYNSIIKNALNQMQNVSKWQYLFIIEIIGLFLSTKGRINFLQLQQFGKHNEQQIYHGIVYATALKRMVNLVIVRTKRKTKWVRNLYFSTDLNSSAEIILKYYQIRFQIEFIYRAAALSDISDEVLEGDMTMEIYHIMHAEAKLSDEDRQAIADWADELTEALFD
jgi:hypothetical protein